MSIRLNQTNSKVIGDKVYITAMKVHSLKESLKKNVVNESNVTHPTLGLLYEYQGEYSRSIKSLK